MQRVIGAVASGDLSKKISADVHGEMLELKNTLNAMVDQLNGFASEVTRVAREVGTEGKLGQAAAVTIEVGGVWKDLTDNVNLMAGNLTGQVRNIAEVTTAVANGDLSKKISADVKGEFLELKNTVNAMVDQLNRFASEVTRVAREVGVEGKLGGQAQSAEVAGVWKDLTDNVNQLAANLTNQVRAIADVATAVTEGDLTRQVGVEASGEVAVLKDKLNEMIRNLRETTRQNTEQDWLKTNLARFTRMLQGQRDLATVSNMILSELAPLVSAQHGVFYTLVSPEESGEPVLRYQAGYGYKERKHLANAVPSRRGPRRPVCAGEAADSPDRRPRRLRPDQFGPRRVCAADIIVLPILFEGSVRAVVELASFSRFSPTHQAFLDQLTESIGLVLNTIEANTLTETLLEQSQSQAQELQSRQEELRGSYEEASRLAEQNVEVERKRQEVELAKRLVEEKAEQLAVSSKYKSEFFSNMSHELRTPLNSLLILAEELKDNPEHNLTEEQVQYASVIHSSGTDLLRLLNDILDLAKVESGTVTLEVSELALDELRDALERDFGPVAEQKGVAFSVELAPRSSADDRNRPRTPAPGAEEPPLQRLQVHRARRGERAHEPDGQRLEPGERQPRPSGCGDRVQHRRHRHRHHGGDAATHLRGVRPGRRHHGAPVRRHGARPVDQPRAGAAARRRDRPHQHARPGEHVHGVPAVGSQRSRRRGRALRRPRLPPRSPSPVPEDSPDPRLTGMKALVVDDDYRNIFAVTTLLERGQLDVVSAESGEEGIAILEQTPDIDIVLVDIMMPVMDGYATIRAMRNLPSGRELPILAVTANVRPRRDASAASTRARRNYISKPIETDALMLVLGRCLCAPAPAGRPPAALR